MQFNDIERGSDRVTRHPLPNHRTNCAHPLFCEVSLFQIFPSETVAFSNLLLE